MAEATRRKAAIVVIATLGGGATLMVGAFFAAGSGGGGTFETPTPVLQAPASAGVGSGSVAANESRPTGSQGVTGVPGPAESATPATESDPLPDPVGVQNATGEVTREAGAGDDAQGPAGWPAAIDFPMRSQIIEEDNNGHVRFVLVSESGIATTGGSIVAALQESGWKVQAVGTVRSATITARRGQESLGISLRDQSSPEGPLTHWDLVYQKEPPPIPDPEPTPSNSLQERA